MAGISIIASGPDAGSAASLAKIVGIAYERSRPNARRKAAERAVCSIEKVRARRQAQLDATPDPRTAS
jgi:hypothetical protein